jgi:hypothetical protein
MNKMHKLIIAALFIPLSTWAVDNKNEKCFNFDQSIKDPLKLPPTALAKKDISDAGVMKQRGSGFWGLARGQVNYSIQHLYQRLLDHSTIKDAKKAKLKTYEQERTGYKDFHLLMVTFPTPVMDVKWEEEWAYKLAEGTDENPKKYVISYQKTNGTKYIPHLCGSIVLTSTGPQTTDVYLYEEINALGKRSPKDTIQGHLGTLNTLRKPASETKKD